MTPNTDTALECLQLDGTPVSLEQVLAVAEGRCRVVLSAVPAFRERISAGNRFLEQLLAEDGVIYGVTTGYGDSCTRAVPPEMHRSICTPSTAVAWVRRSRKSQPARW